MAGYAVNGITRDILLKSLSLFALVLLGACASPTLATQPLQVTLPSTNTSQPAITETVETVTPIPPTLEGVSCEEWQSFSVVPTVSENVRAIYQRGQATGNNPHSFSKVGDGEISTAWFFTMFDLGESYYDLGPYEDLAPAVEHFEGSFERMGMAAKRGFNTERILDPALSDPNLCEPGESPLDCELRSHQPSFAILSLGTNQAWQPEEFERGMRQILDRLLSKNIVPILSTKGDNLEGDQRINRTIACLAQEYDVPLWNFWAAIQPLPNHGLQADLEHLTYGITDFDDEHALQTAWTVRNLTALRALNSVWREVTSQP